MVEISKYYLLIDGENKGAIAGAIADRIYEYVTWNGKEWLPFDMMQYFFEEGAKYDFFKEVSAEEAKVMMRQQTKDFDEICKKLHELGALSILDGDHTEGEIVKIFINSGRIFWEENRQLLVAYPRLALAVEKFNEYVHFDHPNSLYLLREWRNLCPIAIEYFDKQHKTGLLDDERYVIISNYLQWKINVLTEEQVRIVNGENPSPNKRFLGGIVDRIKGL